MTATAKAAAKRPACDGCRKRSDKLREQKARIESLEAEVKRLEDELDDADFEEDDDFDDPDTEELALGHEAQGYLTQFIEVIADAHPLGKVIDPDQALEWLREQVRRRVGA